jgi:hypothetical protein
VKRYAKGLSGDSATIHPISFAKVAEKYLPWIEAL